MIACLGWGSLIWDPRTLPTKGDWRVDGPALPVEFAREAADRRITLVVTEGAPDLDVLWITLDVSSLDEAMRALAEREKIPERNIARDVGYWAGERRSNHHGAVRVGDWAAGRGIETVVWTGLRCGFRDRRGQVPSIGDVLDHLQGLRGKERARAEEYVRRAPRQIRTPNRAVIERELGWTHHR